MNKKLIIIIGVIAVILFAAWVGLKVYSHWPMQPKSEWKQCNSVDDCIFIYRDYCGGIAVSRQHVDDYRAYLTESQKRRELRYMLGATRPEYSACMPLKRELKCIDNKCVSQEICGKEGELLYRFQEEKPYNENDTIVGAMFEHCCDGLYILQKENESYCVNQSTFLAASS